MIFTTSLGIHHPSNTPAISVSQTTRKWSRATVPLPESSRRTIVFWTKSIVTSSRDAMADLPTVGGVQGMGDSVLGLAQVLKLRTMVFWSLDQGLGGWRLCSIGFFLLGTSVRCNAGRYQTILWLALVLYIYAWIKSLFGFVLFDFVKKKIKREGERNDHVLYFFNFGSILRENYAPKCLSWLV